MIFLRGAYIMSWVKAVQVSFFPGPWPVCQITFEVSACPLKSKVVSPPYDRHCKKLSIEERLLYVFCNHNTGKGRFTPNLLFLPTHLFSTWARAHTLHLHTHTQSQLAFQTCINSSLGLTLRLIRECLLSSLKMKKD